MIRSKSENVIEVSEEHTTTFNVINNIVTCTNQETTFYLCDVNDIIEKYKKWHAVMPGIKPYYAVKCNDHPVVLKSLAALGTGFDCASKAEMEKILALGVEPSRIIFAHTVKLPSHIRYAAEAKINLLTFDNELELQKIKKLFPNARTIIRIKYDAKKATILLSNKFGCDPIKEAPDLLKIARQLDINVVGVSFHIGTGCQDPPSFRGAIKAARGVFNIASTIGYDFNILDIGGGYPGKQDNSIAEYANIINSAIEDFFPNTSVEIIAEPGCYFVDSAFTLACSIHSCKEVTTEDALTKQKSTQFVYYIHNSIFGSFRDVINCNLLRILRPLLDYPSAEKYLSVIRGETNYDLDQINSNVWLPKMQLGDWIIFSNMGAYTITLSSVSIDSPAVYSTINEKNWLLVKNKPPFLDLDFVKLENLADKI